MFENLKKSTQPVTKFNKLVMDTVSRVGEMQMASIREYMNMAGKQAKAATQIRDYEDFQRYLSDQTEMFSSLVEKASEDMNELSRMAEEFRQEASDVFHAAEEAGEEMVGAGNGARSTAKSGASSASKSAGTPKAQAAKSKTEAAASK